jgi:hypothetical protein
MRTARLAGLVLASAALAGLAACTGQASKETPGIAARLTELKTLCEGRVQALKQARVDGSRQYGGVESSANACVSYLTTALAGEAWDRKEIEGHLSKVEGRAAAFLRWADGKLHPGQVGAQGVDLVACLSSLVRLLDEHDGKRRAALIKELEKCKFRSWGDIPLGTGHMGSTEARRYAPKALRAPCQRRFRLIPPAHWLLSAHASSAPVGPGGPQRPRGSCNGAVLVAVGAQGGAPLQATPS